MNIIILITSISILSLIDSLSNLYQIYRIDKRIKSKILFLEKISK
jgi:hypothetical protein